MWMIAACAGPMALYLNLALPRRVAGPSLLGHGAASALRDGAAVDSALEEAQVLMGKGDWRAAKNRLVELLAEAGASDALVARWPRIADGLTNCTFWGTYRVPEAEEVVPQIVSWREKSGDLKLRYGRGADGAADALEGGSAFREIELTDGGALFLHPVRFAGPYSVELRGRRLSAKPILYIDWLWGSLKGMGFGTSYAIIVGDTTGVWAFEDGEMTLVDSCNTTLVYDRPYSFEVRVASNSVSVSYNGKRQLKIKRPKGEYGQFGVRDLASFDEIEIVGEVEPAWIAGLVQDSVLGAREEFARGYDPLDEAPQALRDRIVGDVPKQADFGMTCPGAPDDEDQALLNQAKIYYDEEKFEQGLEFVRALGNEQVEDVVRDWMQAIFQLLTGDADAAYEALGRVAEADPEFYEGRLIQTWMTRGRLSEDESLLSHEKLLLDFPGHLEPYESLALFHLFEGRLSEAEEVLGVAASNRVPMQALQDVGITLLRKRLGPSWPEVESYSSGNYVVYSNAGKTSCVRIATELDQTLRRYQNELGRLEGKDEEKFPVYFFAGAAGYRAYCQDLLGTPADYTLGIFHPALKQLLVWDSPDPGSTMRTVRHEGFHQYFDRLVGESPVWLNEGLAEYYEQARFEGGRWKDDHVNEAHVALLKATRDEWTPLMTLVRMENSAFRARSGLHYAESWAFVHYLQNGGRNPKKIFNALLDGLKGGLASSEAVEQAFAGVDARELEREFASYVAGLK